MNSPDNTRRSVLVTGSSTGIGKASALYLDRMGFSVFAGVRRPQDGDALLQEASARLVPVIIDVTKSSTIESAAVTVHEALDGTGLHGLVNNAGVIVPAVLEFIDIEQLREQLEVNVIGQLAVTKAFLPLIRPVAGRIVNIGSLNSYLANAFLGPYAASKHALRAITDALRRELKPFGIKVSLIVPGNVATPIWQKGQAFADQPRGTENIERIAELYGPSVERMRVSARHFAETAIPAERVARVVHRADRFFVRRFFAFCEDPRRSSGLGIETGVSELA